MGNSWTGGGGVRTATKPKRGRPAGTSSEATRVRLVGAARKLFAQRGYQGAGIADIVAEAGVTPPVLYHHFENKAGLYAAAMTEVYDIIIERFAKVVATAYSFPDKLHAMVVAAADLHEEDPTISLFVNSVPAQLTEYPELAGIAPQMTRVQEFLLQLAKDSPELKGSPLQVARAAAVVVSGMGRISSSVKSRSEYRAYVEAVGALLSGELFDSDRKGRAVKKRPSVGRKAKTPSGRTR